MAYINELGQEVLSSETRVIRVPFQARELTVFDRVRIGLEEKYAALHAEFESEEDARDFGGSDADFDDDMTVHEAAAQFYDRVMTEPNPLREKTETPDSAPSETEPEATE